MPLCWPAKIHDLLSTKLNTTVISLLLLNHVSLLPNVFCRENTQLLSGRTTQAQVSLARTQSGPRHHEQMKRQKPTWQKNRRHKICWNRCMVEKNLARKVHFPQKFRQSSRKSPMKMTIAMAPLAPFQTYETKPRRKYKATSSSLGTTLWTNWVKRGHLGWNRRKNKLQNYFRLLTNYHSLRMINGASRPTGLTHSDLVITLATVQCCRKTGRPSPLSTCKNMIQSNIWTHLKISVMPMVLPLCHKAYQVAVWSVQWSLLTLTEPAAVRASGRMM